MEEGSCRYQRARRGNWQVGDPTCCVLMRGGKRFERSVRHWPWAKVLIHLHRRFRDHWRHPPKRATGVCILYLWTESALLAEACAKSSLVMSQIQGLAVVPMARWTLRMVLGQSVIDEHGDWQ